MKKTLNRILALLACCTLAPTPAISGIAEAVASEPTQDMNALLDKAMEYAADGNYDMAIISCDLAARLDPSSPQPCLSLAALRLQMEQYDEALQHVDDALVLAPTLGEAWLLRAQINAELGDADAAWTDVLYAEVCGLAVDAALRIEIAGLHFENSDYEAALECLFDVPLEAFDDDQRTMLRTVLLRTGNREAAGQMGLMDAPLRDAALDAAFAAGTVALAAEDWMPENTEDIELVMSAAEFYELMESDEAFSYEYAVSEDGLTVSIPLPPEDVEDMRTLTPISISPDGAIMLQSANYLFVLRGNQIIRLHAAADRGAEDVHGNLEKFDSVYGKISYEGVEWSPDGRYAAITNCDISLVDFRFFIDPIILDTHTGEMFLAATYPNQMSDGSATAIHTQFDSTGRYLYYGLFGSAYSDRFALMRYDLETGENELCCNPSEYAAMPKLCALNDGRWMNLLDAASGCCGLNVFTPSADGWRYDARLFTEESRYFYPRLLEYSANSGYALIRATASGSSIFLMRFLPDSDFDGMDEYWVIEDLDAASATSVRPGEMLESLAGTEGVTPSAALSQQCATIIGSALSPDGHYALICATKADESALLLLNLETMEIVRVDTALEVSPTAVFTFPPAISWHEDGRLLIMNSNADAVEAYRLIAG